MLCYGKCVLHHFPHWTCHFLPVYNKLHQVKITNSSLLYWRMNSSNFGGVQLCSELTRDFKFGKSILKAWWYLNWVSYAVKFYAATSVTVRISLPSHMYWCPYCYIMYVLYIMLLIWTKNNVIRLIVGCIKLLCNYIKKDAWVKRKQKYMRSKRVNDQRRKCRMWYKILMEVMWRYWINLYMYVIIWRHSITSKRVNDWRAKYRTWYTIILLYSTTVF